MTSPVQPNPQLPFDGRPTTGRDVGLCLATAARHSDIGDATYRSGGIEACRDDGVLRLRVPCHGRTAVSWNRPPAGNRRPAGKRRESVAPPRFPVMPAARASSALAVTGSGCHAPFRQDAAPTNIEIVMGDQVMSIRALSRRFGRVATVCAAVLSLAALAQPPSARADDCTVLCAEAFLAAGIRRRCRDGPRPGGVDRCGRRGPCHALALGGRLRPATGGGGAAGRGCGCRCAELHRLRSPALVGLPERRSPAGARSSPGGGGEHPCPRRHRIHTAARGGGGAQPPERQDPSGCGRECGRGRDTYGAGSVADGGLRRPRGGSRSAPRCGSGRQPARRRIRSHGRRTA